MRESEIHISEIQRRQGHYDDALATLEKAKAQVQDSPELSLNEALIYDALGKYDQATGILNGLLDASSHPDGKYTDEEKQNRAYFLNRLGIIYREQNKTAEAVAAYKQMVDLGGDAELTPVTRPSLLARTDTRARSMPIAMRTSGRTRRQLRRRLPRRFRRTTTMQMVYAQQLADMGQVDQALTLAKAQLTGSPDDLDVRERLARDVHSAEAVQGGERAAGQGRDAGHQAGREALHAVSARRVLRTAEDV